MKQAIDISVIIPNYNYEKYIQECISSVLDSDFSHSRFEIVFVDDASTDKSVSIVNKIKKTTDIQIKLIKHRTNSGLAKARNTGIKNASGKYLFFLDSDNFINRNCLSKHYAFLKKNKDCSACYAPIQRFDNETKELLNIFSNKPYDYNLLVHRNYIDAMAMIRKADILEIGLYDEHMPCSGWEDYELWLRMGINNKKISFIEEEPLTHYRVHTSSMINSIASTDIDNLTRYIEVKYNSGRTSENKNAELNISSIPILTELLLQLYWASTDMAFDEQKSLAQYIKLNESPITTSFEIPLIENIDFIRFDIGEKVGLLNIHQIQIKNNEGEIIWAWDKQTVTYKSGTLFIENNDHFGDALVQLSATKDPQFAVQINGKQFQKYNYGCMVDIILSKVTSNQYDRLNSLNSLLSFHTERHFNELNGAVSSLNEEKESLLSELSTSSNLLNKFSEEKVLLQKNAQANELVIQQLLSDKQNLASDKDLLINEIGQKNNSLNKLIQDTRNLEKDITKKNAQLNELSTTLENITRERERINIDLIEARNYSQQLLLKIEYLEESLNTSKDHYFKTSESLNAIIDQLNVDKSILSTELIEKNELIEKVFIKNDELHNSHTVISKINTELESKIKGEKIRNDFLVTENEVMRRKVSDSEIIHSKLADQNKSLELTIKDKQETLNELLRGKRNIEELYTGLLMEIDLYKEQEENLNILIHEGEQENQLLNESIILLKWEINNYKDNYDKKSLFQIAKSRILKKQ